MSDNARVPAIYTIGYGHRPTEEFVALLKEHGIAFLGDVRSRPYSRFNPDFSRESIEAIMGSHGIRYVFLGDTLGGDPRSRSGTPTSRPFWTSTRSSMTAHRASCSVAP